MVEKEKDPEYGPEITPEMIQQTFGALEARGLIYYYKGGLYVPTKSGWKLFVDSKKVREEITAWGHPNVKASHSSCIEITKSDSLRKEGDCIVGVKADKSCKQLTAEMKT